ncbi:hypothetical protein L0B53_18710 (plasmid) [Vibrio sp. SS-MA-C1-2]|uniref:hypothetical protein n=1 Tax=Vibrio sp. SS-MA-C1-2 TaxID=2908646 RepID=UPI001F38FA91|nr:hypothetical protein [Vibrio sp. SS-MA-C1-2]UJF20353.1 hypothetical protein L0B53_18710 [Vibrio sp. SS-MA-C1-2]
MKTKLISILTAVTLTAPTFAENSSGTQEAMDIVAIEQPKTLVQQDTPEAVHQMLNTVVTNLPTEQRNQLKPMLQKDEPKPQTDDFGRPIVPTEEEIQENASKTTSVAETKPIYHEPEKPQLTAFQMMQRDMAKKFKPVQSYKLRTGDNITIPAAKYILNSIRTSFDEVEVRSSDPNVVLKVEGSYLYFTTEYDSPFGLIMYEKGVPETQVNVTVVPLNVMPAMVQVTVKYDKKLASKVAKIKQDQQNEASAQEARIRDMESELVLKSDPKFMSNPYVDSINDLLSVVAAKKRPKGFDFSTKIPSELKYPCRFTVPSEAKQRLISSRRIVDIVLVKNIRDISVIIREEQCWNTPDVIATGILNKATLSPGEATEVYVVRDRLYQNRIKERNERPSLLD